MVAYLRPKKWLFGDEGPTEQDLQSKNTQNEAELEMCDLIHKDCHCSPAESKKMELLRQTVESYVQAMSPSLTNLGSISTLFQNFPFQDFLRGLTASLCNMYRKSTVII